MSTIIDKIYSDNKVLTDYLGAQREISFKNDVNNSFKKILLLSIASFFESRITEIIIEFVAKKTIDSGEILNFVKAKAIARQYHTLFNWDSKNCNQFLGYFGDSFKNRLSNVIKENTAIDEGVKCFIEIGAERNKLVHQNFATYYLEKTTEEIYELYQKALIFIKFLEDKFS